MKPISYLDEQLTLKILYLEPRYLVNLSLFTDIANALKIMWGDMLD